jgi:multidrug resistance efflux pump
VRGSTGYALLVQHIELGGGRLACLDQARDALLESEAAVKVALANEQQARVAYEETADASIKIAIANEEKARLAYTSEINGENTTVAQVRAELALAQYYLDNTTLVAPEDGRIVNLQVEPGMVSGIFRIGGIASFIVDADRYVLATYNQEVLKYVKDGQPVEVQDERLVQLVLDVDLHPIALTHALLLKTGGKRLHPLV